MHRENEERRRLSPWEQGVAYKRALTEGLFTSQRRLAESLGVSHTWINICLQIATLPPDVLAAFRTPMEIQPGQATRLAAACTINRQGVVNVARQLCDQQGETRMKASDVVDRLTVTAGQLPSASALFLAGQKVGMSERRSSGRFTVSFSIKQLDEDTCAKVTAAIQLALREVETKFPPGDLSPPLRPALTVVTGDAGDACTSVQDS